MSRIVLVVLSFYACGQEMSTYPPDGYAVTGSGPTWGNDFAIIEGIGGISAVADAGGGDIRCTTGAAHNLVVNQYVRLEGTTNYDDEYVVTNVSDTTHFDVTATYVSTDTGTFYLNFCGPDTIRFENTDPGEPPFYVYDTSIAIDEGVPYRMSVLLQTSDATSAEVYIYLDWYDADDSLVSSQQLFSGDLTAVGTWERISFSVTPPVGARGVRPKVGKGAANFYLWLDDIAFEEMPFAFKAYLSSNTSYASTSTIVYDTEIFDHAGAFDNSTGEYTIPKPGIYTFIVEYGIGTFNSGESAYPMIQIDGNDVAHGNILRAHANGQSIYSNMSFTEYLTVGQVVRVKTYHQGGSKTAAGGSAEYIPNFFSGFLVE